MATLRAKVKAVLTSDVTLMALLPGSILDAEVLDYSGEGSSQAPREADGVTLKTHAVIRWGSVSPNGSGLKIGDEAETFEIYVYQDVGFDVIESVLIKIKKLLHDTYLTTDDRALAHVIKIFTSGEMPAEELGNAACRFVRFAVITAPL